MSQPGQGDISSPPADHPVKRKRGRPRKDESLGQGENMIATPGSDSVKKNKCSAGTSNGGDDMVGQMVYGVIEGAFNDGYLLNVKVGDTDTHLRGLVFLPGRAAPITAANDVAPHAKMYKRKELPIPVFNPNTQHHGFNTPSQLSDKQPDDLENSAVIYPDQVPLAELQSGVPASQSPSIMAPLVDNSPKYEASQSLEVKVTSQQTLESGPENQLTTVMAQMEHDEVKQAEGMQELEVSTLMKGPDIDADETNDLDSEPAAEPYIGTSLATETIDQEPQVQHQAVSSEVNLGELIIDEVKSLGDPKFVPFELVSNPADILMGQEPSPMKNVPQDEQNSVSGEPKYVPSELISEPVDFLMEKQASPIKGVPDDSENIVFGEPKFKLTELISEPVNILMEKQGSPVQDLTQALQNPESAEFTPMPMELITEPVDILKENLASPNIEISQDTQICVSAEVTSMPLELINCVSVEPKTVPLKLNSEPVDILMEKQSSPVKDSSLYIHDPVFGEPKSGSFELVFGSVDPTKDMSQDTQSNFVADSSGGDNSFHTIKLNSDAFDVTLHSAQTTCQQVTMLEGDSVQSEATVGAEGSVLPRTRSRN